MARKPTPKPAQAPTSEGQPDDPAQYQRFLDMARELEADEAPDAMDRAFGKVIRQPPRPKDDA